MRITWYPPDTRDLLRGSLTIHHYIYFSVVRCNGYGWNIVRVSFDEPNEVREVDREAFMQTILFAAELKVQDWKEKNETAV